MFSANVTGCKLILKMLWLVQANFIIMWLKKTVLFKNNISNLLTKKVLSIQAQSTKVYDISATLFWSSFLGFSNSILTVACVTLREFIKICKTKGLNAYLVQWQDMIDSASSLNAEVIVKVVTENN